MKLTISNAYEYNGTIDGYVVGAIDGTKFFGSNKKFCPGCLKNNNNNFHSGVVISTIGDGPILTVEATSAFCEIRNETLGIEH